VTAVQNVGSKPARVGVVGVCLDLQSINAITHCVTSIAGAAVLGNVERYVGAEREAARSLESSQNKICIIDYDQNPDEAIWITERLRNEQPEISTFALSAYSQPERIITAMRAGCAEFLLKPVQAERIIEGISRVEAKQRERQRSKARRGKVITLIGAKGGTGVTSLALHLSIALTGGKNKRCVLVDQHPALGDASLYLGTGRHQYSFYELASNAERLDEELLQGLLLHHDTGLDLLDSPEALGALHQAPPSGVEQALSFLAEVYNYVVVDCPPGLTDATLAGVAQSDFVAIVMTAELPAVRNTVRYLEHLSQLGYDEKKIQVVLNRYSKKAGLADDRIEKALKRPISVRIPNSYNEVIQSINAGTPIAGNTRSEFSSAMEQWAQRFAGAKPTAPTPKSGVLGIFGR